MKKEVEERKKRTEAFYVDPYLPKTKRHVYLFSGAKGNKTSLPDLLESRYVLAHLHLHIIR